MARAAVRGRLNWTLGEVVELTDETPRVRTIFLEVPEWPGHRAGQHIDVRLTAEDGYQAQRSYSIASAPEDGRLAITVERLPDGEVSEYLVGELRRGDMLELRGPIGGYFVWEARSVGARLLYSSRSWDEVIYRDELERLAAGSNGPEVIHTLTRSQPPGWKGYARRVDGAMLAEAAWATASMPMTFVCGPTSFVESVAGGLVLLGYPPSTVKTERFGPTGG